MTKRFTLCYDGKTVRDYHYENVDADSPEELMQLSRQLRPYGMQLTEINYQVGGTHTLWLRRLGWNPTVFAQAFPAA